ncbi:hypothetical protein [Halobellus limi]|jgi:hypothetical protein|uniref:DUF8141 domain-containing protein n=1 Tax=Halobellus limi TaxID=699433 RepID=A0A1H6CPG3_9EURY|nr:hypothetical protein [Halobellus limi]QCC48719.1 hypothetical protein DV707_14220 [Halobellus limi]SEG74316.1 hypothetical protein SAMN04488133_3578 [Halobellus limi]
MFPGLSRWFDAQPFQRQIVVLAVVLDPIGFLAGYLLGPSVGVDPLLGGVYGLVAASLPMSLFVMRSAQ